MDEIRFNTSDEFSRAILECISTLHRPAAGALVSIAAHEGADSRELVSGRLLVSESEEDARDPLCFGTVALSEQWIPVGQLGACIAALAKGSIEVGGVSIRAAFSEFTLARELGSYNNVSGWPEWRACLRSTTRRRDYPQVDVIQFGLPPYRNAAHASNDWVHRQPRRTDANALLFPGELVMALPDSRGRLLRAEWIGGTLKVASESRSADASALQLQVRFVGDVERPVQMLTPCPPDAEVAIPAGTESILVYLVHREAGLLAERSVGAYDRQRQRPSVEVVTLEAEIERDLAGGESEYVEFKPFVKVQDPKEDELERSLVAFANSRGGRLYVGVTDEGLPLGARALKDVVKDGADQKSALSVLARRLETVIADRIKPERPVFQVHELEYKGFPLLMVRVDQGAKAYSTAREAIYVRHQANNYRASIAEIRELLSMREAPSTAILPSVLNVLT